MMRQDWQVKGPMGECVEKVWEPGQAAERYGRRYFAEALAKGHLPGETLRVTVHNATEGHRYRVRCRIVVQADLVTTCDSPCQVAGGCGGRCQHQDAHEGPCHCGTCDCEWGGYDGVRPGLG